MALPLYLEILGWPDFPLPPIGLVHIANRIDQWRPIFAQESLDFRIVPAPIRPSIRGFELDFLTQIFIDQVLVWQSTATYLKKTAASHSLKATRSPPAEGERKARPMPGPYQFSDRWSLPGRLGWQFATLTGDVNPIHLSRPTARLVGQPRQLIHGMWNVAHALGRFKNLLPEYSALISQAVSCSVQFKRPLYLPGEAILTCEYLEGQISFMLVSQDLMATHLIGTLSPIPK